MLAAFVLALTAAGRPAPVRAAAGADAAAAAETGVFSTRVVDDVRVHSGEIAPVTYRAEALAGGAVVADLLVTTLDGVPVRALVRDRVIAVGVRQVWRGRLRLPVGAYRLVVRARDELGRARRLRPPRA